MKHLVKIILLNLCYILLFFISCSKELSCEGCAGNKPPVATAGEDQIITSPIDSVFLDGGTSNDPDGKITEWLWTWITGPGPVTIGDATASKTWISNLVSGVYQLELKVTDDGGLNARDTVQLTVVDLAVNQQPVACAGADQTINMPASSVYLDGSCSTDPDDNISSYLWTNIAGPLPVNNINADSVQTQVSGLVKGVYQFELKVTDAGALFAKDTIQITVLDSSPILSFCSERPNIHARLVPIGSLSIPRVYMSSAAAGNKILGLGISFAKSNGSVRVR